MKLKSIYLSFELVRFPSSNWTAPGMAFFFSKMFRIVNCFADWLINLITANSCQLSPNFCAHSLLFKPSILASNIDFLFGILLLLQLILQLILHKKFSFGRKFLIWDSCAFYVYFAVNISVNQSNYVSQEILVKWHCTKSNE